MKITVYREALVECLAAIAPAIRKLTPKPLLQCAKIEVFKDRVEVTGNNTELQITTSTDRLDIKELGVVTTPHDRLIRVLSEMPDTTIDIETDGEIIRIKGENSDFNLFGYDTSQFPEPMKLENAAPLVVTAKDFGAALNMVRPCVGSGVVSNSNIPGVMMERVGTTLNLIATTGTCMAVADIGCGGGGGIEAVIPAAAVGAIAKLLDSEGDVAIIRDGSLVSFSFGSSRVVTNILEVKFFPYRDIIPKTSNKKLTVNLAGLVQAVRQADLVTIQETKGSKFTMSASGLTVTTQTPEYGDASVRVPIVSYSGDPLVIGFNASFLLPPLRGVTQDIIEIEMTAANKPAMVKVPGLLLIFGPIKV